MLAFHFVRRDGPIDAHDFWDMRTCAPPHHRTIAPPHHNHSTHGRDAILLFTRDRMEEYWLLSPRKRLGAHVPTFFRPLTSKYIIANTSTTNSPPHPITRTHTQTHSPTQNQPSPLGQAIIQLTHSLTRLLNNKIEKRERDVHISTNIAAESEQGCIQGHRTGNEARWTSAQDCPIEAREASPATKLRHRRLPSRWRPRRRAVREIQASRQSAGAPD
jgi:hypothetical protein